MPATEDQEIPGETEERGDAQDAAAAEAPTGDDVDRIPAEPADGPGMDDEDGDGQEEPQGGDAVIAVRPRRRHSILA